MKERCFTVECDAQTHTTIWVTREFKYLVGKQCPEGSEFIQALGMFDNFSVANGQNTEEWTTKPRAHYVSRLDATFGPGAFTRSQQTTAGTSPAG